MGSASRAPAGYSGVMVIERGWMACRREKGNFNRRRRRQGPDHGFENHRSGAFGTDRGCECTMSEEGTCRGVGNDRKLGREPHGVLIAGPVLEGWGVRTDREHTREERGESGHARQGPNSKETLKMTPKSSQ